MGLDATGHAAWARRTSASSSTALPGNLIGGAAPGAGNFVTGDSLYDVAVIGSGSANNVVSGNFVGLDSTGEAALAAAPIGIIVDEAPNNPIGGTTAGSGNIVGGHTIGIDIAGMNASGNVVVGNLIGQAPGYAPSMANTYGIIVADAPNVVVGGTSPGSANVITGNKNNPVVVSGPHATGDSTGGNMVG